MRYSTLLERESNRILYFSHTYNILTLIIRSNNYDIAELDVDILLSYTLISSKKREYLYTIFYYTID
jgi:hypothetical protein